MKKMFKNLLFIILLFTFINCGSLVTGFGNKEDKKNDSQLQQTLLLTIFNRTEPASFSVTNTGFSIIDNYPEASETNVSTNSVIRIKFDADIDKSTLTTDNIQLIKGVNLVNFTFETDTPYSLIIQPSKLLDINTIYTLKITSNVASIKGEKLSNDFNLNFTTFNSDPDSGNVVTLAGSGSPGNNDGTGTSASFNNPQGMVLDTAENFLYLADSGNHRIRRISISSGLVNTVAGSTLGFTAGTGLAARFNSPRGIFRINGDTFFISDSVNNGVRRMTSAFVVTNNFGTNVNTAGFTIANSTTTNRYRSPEAMVVDFYTGNYYVSDTNNHCIRRSNGNGQANTTGGNTCFAGANPSAGNGTSGFINGLLSGARFNSPKGLAVDSVGNIYVADSGNHSIRKITTTGIVSTIAGDGSSGYTNGEGALAKFNNPTAIAIIGDTNLYVVDTGNCAIRKLVLDENKVFARATTFAGPTPDKTPECGLVNSTRLNSRFNAPRSIWIGSNRSIYIGDTGNHNIRKITE